MIRAIDEAAFKAAGLTFERPDEATALFSFDDRPEVVRVAVVDGRLHFVPTRSAGQRDVLAALGVTVEPPQA